MPSKPDFAEFYKRHFEAVYRICYIFMQNATDAEDCTEDVFVKAMSAEFNDEKHERAWLTVTAKNLCRDRLKHWWRKKTEPIDDYAETLSGGEDHYDETLEAVMSLPVKYKDVVYLYYYEGYPTEDIAKLLKKPASTIRNYLSEARKKLKEALGGDFE